MDHLFEENLTNTKQRGDSEQKPSVSNRFANPRVFVPLLVALLLWLGISPVHSTEKSSQRGTDETVSPGITTGVVENKIEDIKERIKLSESAENDYSLFRELKRQRKITLVTSCRKKMNKSELGILKMRCSDKYLDPSVS